MILKSNIRSPHPLTNYFLKTQRCATKLHSLPFSTDEKKPESFDSGFLIVVGEEGFEPPTLWSQTRCATKLRYSPTMFRLTRPRSLIKDNLNNGVANEAWTRDNRNHNPGLYQLSYSHHYKWSVKRDSNPRPSGPKPDALPNCAIHRLILF